MKIHFSNVNFSSRSGPNSFAGRLAEQFALMGNDIVEDPSHQYDVFLAFIEPSTRPHPKSKKVVRIDGIWFKPEEFENNRHIKRAYQSFDTVIWQSEFDREMTQKWFGKRDGYVIPNGIGLKQAKPYPFPDNFDDFPKKHKYFVCASNWHGQKRLPDNIKLFKKIRADLRAQDIDSTLLVLGEVPDDVWDEIKKVYPFPSPERIAWLGNKSHEVCMSIYARCDYMIHLAWLDHCPNVVIEALSQDCPVICTDSGGTSEIVKDNGIVIPETTPYEFDLLDYDKPYALDLDSFVLPDEPPKVNNNYLDIEMVARRYLGAMR